jgi:hypothetical protein
VERLELTALMEMLGAAPLLLIAVLAAVVVAAAV